MSLAYAVKFKSKQELDGDTERGTCEQHFFMNIVLLLLELHFVFLDVAVTGE